MIYADTSALMKLVRREEETDPLRAWIGDHADTLLTNTVGVVELQRAAARVSPAGLAAARSILRAIDQIPITSSAVRFAATARPATLRTLDALHLASAATTDGITAFLCYDDRLIEASTSCGLSVSSPS